jgi:hypothetical protein
VLMTAAVSGGELLDDADEKRGFGSHLIEI